MLSVLSSESSGRNGNRTVLAVAAVCILATIVRLPGVFWGFEFDEPLRLTEYHADEIRFVGMARETLTNTTNDLENYPKGFGFQMALLTVVVDTSPTFAQLYLFGRLLSVGYGAATALVVFALVRQLSTSLAVAIVAALFVSLAGLSVTESHYATADAANTFWLYTLLLLCTNYLRDGSNRRLLLIIIATGVGFSVKMSLVTLAPLAIVLGFQRKRPLAWALATAGSLGCFWLANGGRYTSNNFLLTVRNVLEDNVDAIQDHNGLMNVPVYAAELAAGVGLPVVLLAAIGGAALLRRAVLRAGAREKAAWVVAVTILAHVGAMCFVDVPFARHMLPAIPAVAVLGAYGFHVIFARRIQRFAWALSTIVVYQLAYVATTEYFYVNDTREMAWEWIRMNVTPGEEIGVTPYAVFPDAPGQYRVTEFDAVSPYIVMHEAYYYRYVRSELTPASAFPRSEEVYHGTPEHFVLIQRLLKGESGRALLKTFDVKAWTPELWVYKRILGTYPLFIGDVLIFGPRLAEPS